MNDILKKMHSYLEKASDDNPLKIAYIARLEYYHDFERIVLDLCSDMSNRQLEDFLKTKFLLGQKYDLMKYLQAACELNIVNYAFQRYKDSVIYEPKYNGKKSPECSFIYKGTSVNIEVKTPDMINRWLCEDRNTLKLFAAERIPGYTEVINDISSLVRPNIDEKYDGIEPESRLDNKLKDYLVSAQSKFPDSYDDNFNLLVISLCEIKDLDEWYNYLFASEGIFTQNSYVKENYNRIDAIALTDTVMGHINFGEVSNTWDMSSYFSFVFLNPDREHTKTGKFYFNEMLDFMYAKTEDFFAFLQKLDEKSKIDNEELRPEPELRFFNYAEQKIVDLQIFTEYVNDFEKRVQEFNNQNNI